MFHRNILTDGCHVCPDVKNTSFGGLNTKHFLGGVNGVNPYRIHNDKTLKQKTCLQSNHSQAMFSSVIGVND